MGLQRKSLLLNNLVAKELSQINPAGAIFDMIWLSHNKLITIHNFLIHRMYERIFNQSRTSLTTNSSRATRIVRKRDSNISMIARSRSRNKEDQCNTSFEEYLNKQTRYLEAGNVEACSREKSERESEANGNQANEADGRIGGERVPLTLGQTLMALQLNRTPVIERGDRYIGYRMSARQENSPESKQLNQQQNQSRQKKGRRREPTPVKSKKELSFCPKNSEAIASSESQVFQLELRITGLEQILQIEKKQKSIIENKLKQSMNDAQNLKEILNQLEMQNKILFAEKRKLQEKVKTLQKTVLQSQTNLTLAQNNLSKLRQTIKENRLNQAQLELKRCQRANQLLKESNTTQAQAISTLSSKLAATTKELEEVRKLGNMQTLASKQSMKEEYLQKELDRTKKQYQIYKTKCQETREHFLEEKINEQEKIINQLQAQIGRLMVRMHCLEYIKSKEVKDIKQSSDAEIKSLRVKYSRMMVDLKTKSTVSSSIESLKLKKASPVKQKNSYHISCGELKKGSIASMPYKNSLQDYAPSRTVLSCGQEYRTSSIGNKIYAWEKTGNSHDFALELSPE